MDNILFNPEAYKKGYFVGSFSALEELKNAAERVAEDHPLRAQYEAFLKTTGEQHTDGSIFTSAFNKDLLERRLATLKSELENPEGVPALTDFLRYHFEQAAKDKAGPLKVLSISTQRPNLFFALDKDMPELQAQVMRYVPDDRAAEESNKLVSSIAPHLSERFKHTANFKGQSFDVVVIDQALMYNDEESMLQMFKDIAETGAKKILIQNVHGVAGHYGQRYSGGIIPFWVPTTEQIRQSLKTAGFDIEVAELGAKPAIADPVYLDQVPFERNFAAAPSM